LPLSHSVGPYVKKERNLNYLRSKRIILRPIILQDAREIFSYRSDPEIYQFQSWQPKTIEDVEEFIVNRIVGEPNKPNTWFQLAICKMGSDEIIGDCGLHFLENDDKQVEFGITLQRDYQGRGYATEALKLIFEYIFMDLTKHRIIASVDPNNIASIRLCERMKMRKEAHFIESIWFHDHWIDDVVYAILNHEWKTCSDN
jgi:RimJ/RimL family protein N-acetyltransferase